MNALAQPLGEPSAAFPPCIKESISPVAIQIVRARIAARPRTDVSGVFSDQIAIEPKFGSEALTDRQAEEAKKRVAAQEAAEKRLEELKEIAVEDGYEISSASEKALRAFLAATPFSKRPYITLLDNGNVRALWEDETAGEQIGLQFLNRDFVQFVIFVRRERDGESYIARAAGRDLITNIVGQIENHCLRRLMG